MATPEEMAETMIRNLPEKTGRDLQEWLQIIDASGLEKHGQIVKHLKAEHGMTHGFANLVAQRKLRAPTGADDPVAALYGGAKAGLRPIHDRIVGIVQAFGGDVEVSPKKTYVSLRRGKQFALVQPSTRTRVDLGLCLPDVAAEGRLEEAGSFNGMVTHRVRIGCAADVDEAVVDWLKRAYQRA